MKQSQDNFKKIGIRGGRGEEVRSTSDQSIWAISPNGGHLLVITLPKINLIVYLFFNTKSSNTHIQLFKLLNSIIKMCIGQSQVTLQGF